MKLENQTISQEQQLSMVVDEEGINEYEKMLRKIEGENRNHIKVSTYIVYTYVFKQYITYLILKQIEHMMKIYSDSLQDKIDEYEKSKIGYKEKIKSLQEVYTKHK